MNKLPEGVTAIRAVTYNVANIVEMIVDASAGDIKAEDVTLEEIMDIVADYATEDLESSAIRIVYRDENGEEL